MKSIRRVVTGMNGRGKSAVIFDELAGNKAESSHWPDMGITLIWRTNSLPGDNSGTADAVGGKFDLTLAGTEFMVFHCPPLSDLDQMTPEERQRAWQPKALLPDSAREDKTQHPGMHQHNTTDYLTVVSGEITLILEDGEVTLKAGDTAVNRGSAHAWENRGTAPAIVTSVSLVAKPDQTGMLRESSDE